MFLGLQAIVAVVYLVISEPTPWAASIAWWPVTITVANLVSFGLLRWRASWEGLRWSELLRADFRRAHVGKDLLAMFVAAFWLSAQHLTMSFLPDARFMLWCLGMFLPFAIFFGRSPSRASGSRWPR